MTRAASARNPGVTRPPLTRETVLVAALALVDRHGLDALSMRRLGKELGVEAMSLYNHIPNKAALLDGLVEQVIAEAESDLSKGDWESQVRMMAETYRKACLRHPQIVPLIVMRPFNTLAALRPVEEALSVFRRAGFDDKTALHAFRTVTSFTSGYALAESGGFFGEHQPTDATSVIGASDLPREAFPNLVELLPFISDVDHDEEFDFALTAIIEGLRTKL